MTITNGYATLLQIKSLDRLNISTADSSSDTTLEGIITSISRSIDRYCGQYFYKSTAAETRYFTALESSSVFVGNIVSVSALYTDSGDRSYANTWSTSDYDLFPYNSTSLSEPEPFRFIDVSPIGTYRFPALLSKGVKLSAVYGWNAVPTSVTEACLLWSERWFKRYKTPLGISAMSPLGEQMLKVPPPDPDVIQLLHNYRYVAV